MNVRGKTLEEIKETILSWDPNSNPTFKEKVSNEGLTVVLYTYEYISYSQKHWKNITYKEKQYLIIMDGKVHWIRNKYKNAKLAIGILPKPKVPREIRCQKSYDYDHQIVKQSRAFCDLGGHCSVRTLANIAHITFAEARSICIEYGYDKNGMSEYKIKQMIKDYGIKLEDLTNKVRQTARTVKTFERQNFPGKWVIFVRGHVLASINGVITDWSAERNLHIEGAYKVA